MTQRVNLIKADRNTSLEVFEKLSRLDRMLLPEEGWSAESFRSEAEKENGCVLYIMENNCIAALLTGYYAVGEGDITNVAVHPDFRRKGLAKLLIEEFGKILPKDTESIFLEVRESNAPAISLYESCGFRQIGLRKNFYSSPREHAVIMEKILLEG